MSNEVSDLDLKNRIYDFCGQEPDRVYHQEDLLSIHVIPNNDVVVLMRVVQSLVDDRVLKLVTRDGSAAWMYRPQEEARKYQGLSQQAQDVYSLIDDAGAEGIWHKVIKTRLNISDNVMRAATKALEGKRLITEMKSVEHTTRKMWIKVGIHPSERATGGPWYTDNELDQEFIDNICNVLLHYIRTKSLYRPSTAGGIKKPKKIKSGNTAKRNAEEAIALRDATLGKEIKVEERDYHANRQTLDYQHYLPMPPGYRGYPTLRELTLFIERSGITPTTLAKEDIQVLLDVLCYDQLIERIFAGSDGVAYKASRRSAQEMEDGPVNGLTEAPCGRCPVFDLCEEGGPVAPSNCEYFTKWLGVGS